VQTGWHGISASVKALCLLDSKSIDDKYASIIYKCFGEGGNAVEYSEALNRSYLVALSSLNKRGGAKLRFSKKRKPKRRTVRKISKRKRKITFKLSANKRRKSYRKSNRKKNRKKNKRNRKYSRR
jgi:hypothetical protein